jgi:hypothetical protein
MNILFRLKDGQPPQAVIDYLEKRGILENKVEVRMVVIKDGEETRVGLLDLLRSHLEQRHLRLRSEAKLKKELKSLVVKSDARRTVLGGRDS